MVLAILATSAACSYAATISGIDSQIFLPDSAGAESDDTVSCFAAIYPYSTWQPSINSSARQPTSSPVPPYVEGSIDFSIFNYGKSPIQAPWTLGIYNPYYTQVLQVPSLAKDFMARHSTRRFDLQHTAFAFSTFNLAHFKSKSKDLLCILSRLLKTSGQVAHIQGITSMP